MEIFGIGKEDWSHRILTFLAHHWRKFVVTTGVVVFGIVATLLVLAYVDGQRESAAELFYKAMQEKDINKKSIIFDEIEKEYSWLGISDVAVFAKALSELTVEESTAKAIEDMKKLSEDGRTPFVRVAALFEVGAYELKKGNYEAALESYRKAAKVRGNLLIQESKFKEALVLEKIGKLDEARSIYLDLIKNLTDDDKNLKDRCEERMIWLDIPKG